MCTCATTAPMACNAATICPASHMCVDGTCVPFDGRCELDADCPSGQQCLSGWCGTGCGSGCGSGEACVMDRCVKSCTKVSECNPADACVNGGCVPEYAFISFPGGDQSLWKPGTSDDGGGCAVGGHAGTGAALLSALGLVLGGLARRRRR